MLVKLTAEEKKLYCERLGANLKRLRYIAGLTQDVLADLSGISKERLSRIENGAFTMKWSQFVNLIMIFSMNVNSKEYLVASKIYTPRLIGALQMKDDKVPPDLSVPISEALINEFNTDFRITSSMSYGDEMEIKKEQ